MDKVWWNHITKAHKFFEDIVETAVKGSSMLLSLPASVPWKETLIEMIGERLQLENPKNAFQEISCPKEEPGEYLLTNYCKKEIRLKYRYGMSYAQFLGACQETVLNDRYIWISDVSKEKCEEWLEFIEEYKYQKERILGVSIATQGIISPDGSGVMYGTIMNNVKMRMSDFSSKLPYPCRLVHDSKAAAYLELWNHSELDSAVVFLLNRNLGGAIITNRKVHEGSFMHSGVIEHICINSDGPLCYCGNRGCLETYCSANSLSEIAGMSIKEFFEKLRENKEENIKQIWKEYLKHLAFAMRNLNLVVDGPIIISGYLAPYFMENDLNYLLKQINLSLPFEFPKENLIVGTNGQYTPAIGAALFYVKKFIDGIAPTI